MNDQQNKNIRDFNDDSKEETIWTMARDFYSREMLPVAIIVWVWAIIFFVPAVYCVIQLFRTDTTRSQIIYAAIFVVCFQGICLMKSLAWQMLTRNSITREIKRLELRIPELVRSIADKS